MQRILLIEGNTNIRKFISRELARSGHTVMETADGIEGLERLKDDKPEILIVDINTKKKIALEQFRVAATSSKQSKKIPVILLTSNPSYEAELSDWNAAFILDRSGNAPELLAAIDKLRSPKPPKTARPKEAKEARDKKETKDKETKDKEEGRDRKEVKEAKEKREAKDSSTPANK
ncbi:MAG: response regulator [Pseudomonadota bacterium]